MLPTLTRKYLLFFCFIENCLHTHKHTHLKHRIYLKYPIYLASQAHIRHVGILTKRAFFSLIQIPLKLRWYMQKVGVAEEDARDRIRCR